MNFNRSNRCLGCVAWVGLKTATGHKLAAVGAIAMSKYVVGEMGETEKVRNL